MGLVSKRPEDDADEELREIQITGFGDLDASGPTPVGLDLTTWGEAGRAALDERLHLLDAPHGWDGAILIVDEADMAWIARIIEQVEDERSIALDPEADQIAYDLTGWDDVNRSLLVHGLQERALAFGVEADELVVHEADEDAVDALIDQILEPDPASSGLVATDAAADDEALGEEPREELLGDLFVLADLLVHDPRDEGSHEQLAARSAEVAGSRPPYGVERAWWRAVGERLTGLEALVAPGDQLDDDDVVAAATALRDELREVV